MTFVISPHAGKDLLKSNTNVTVDFCKVPRRTNARTVFVYEGQKMPNQNFNPAFESYPIDKIIKFSNFGCVK